MLKLIIFGSLLYLLIVIFIYLYQDHLLFFPNNQEFRYCHDIKKLNATPIELNFQNERIRFYHFDHPKANAIALIFHGNAGSACDRAFYIQKLNESTNINISIILAEYPGYSRERQTISEQTILSNADALFEYIQSINSKRVPIILYGESLGCAVATYLASKYKIDALILQSPFTSITELAGIHYPFLPARWIIRNRFDAKIWAKTVKVPVLILQGENDQIITLIIARKQANNFPRPPTFKQYENFGHNDITLDNPDYWQAVLDFLLRTLSANNP